MTLTLKGSQNQERDRHLQLWEPQFDPMKAGTSLKC